MPIKKNEQMQGMEYHLTENLINENLKDFKIKGNGSDEECIRFRQ